MLFPTKQYCVQLSLIYGARENYRHSLDVQQVAYLQGRHHRAPQRGRASTTPPAPPRNAGFTHLGREASSEPAPRPC